MHSKLVRTYLDPDSVGPLPRAVVADDSDAVSAAQTMVRLPDSPTQELRTADVLEVFDPNQRSRSLAPVDYDTSEIRLKRRLLTKYVLAAVGVAAVLLVAAVIKCFASSDSQEALTPAPSPTPMPTFVVSEPAASARPTVDVTVGTLRVDGVVDGQPVYVDGVALTATAALLRCGPHQLAVGTRTRSRSIDVPCGGEVTVFR